MSRFTSFFARTLYANAMGAYPNVAGSARNLRRDDHAETAQKPSRCMEEHDLVVLMYRLPTEAVDVESFRTPQVFHPKGRDADALVHGLRLSFCERKKRHRCEV